MKVHQTLDMTSTTEIMDPLKTNHSYFSDQNIFLFGSETSAYLTKHLLCDVLLSLMLDPIFFKISIYTQRDICYCPLVIVSYDICV